VGFISDLPTQLVAAFRATLEEVLSADLILPCPRHLAPRDRGTGGRCRGDSRLAGGEAGRAAIEVWNKLDLVAAAPREALLAQAGARPDVFAVSALTGEGVEGLLEAISTVFDEEKTDRLLRLAFAEGRRRAWLHAEGVVEDERQDEDGWQVAVRWTARQERRWRELPPA
jgi:GTP-binding protein HflX